MCLASWVRGALGLIIWANAVTEVSLSTLSSRDRDCRSGDGRAYASRLTTLEAAWLLSGLLHDLVRNPKPSTEEITAAVMQELESRYTKSGALMPHAGDNAPLRHRVRNHVANFADQIHTVQAMAFASIVLESRPALELARKLAARVVALQGPQGQWWWHYDTRSASVAEEFPVFSVHQHSMAPMALMALEAAGGDEMGMPIQSSHRWLAHNELGVSLVDKTAHTIWRDVERSSGLSRRVRQVQSILSLHRGPSAEHRPRLRLNRGETRPYEWGWCLYAGAIANGLERGSHIV